MLVTSTTTQSAGFSKLALPELGCASVRVSVLVSFRVSVHVSVRVSVHVSVRVSVHVSVRVIIRVSVRVYIRVSVRVSVRVSIRILSISGKPLAASYLSIIWPVHMFGFFLIYFL